MVRPRTEFDALQPTQEPRWFVVRTVHGRIVKSRRLPPNTHLVREFLTSVIAYIDEGWNIGEFSLRSAFYVATKVGERVEVMISATNPHEPIKPMYGA